MIRLIRRAIASIRLRRQAYRKMLDYERRIREFGELLDQSEERWTNPYIADWAPCVAYISDEFRRFFPDIDKK